MITCLVITATYDSFVSWCKYNGFKKLNTNYVKAKWTIKGFKILKKAKYVTRPEHLVGYYASEIEIIKAGRFVHNPLYLNGYSRLVENLEHSIKMAWDRSYMTEIDQEFDKLLEEI